jgi:hypothetical protein
MISLVLEKEKEMRTWNARQIQKSYLAAVQAARALQAAVESLRDYDSRDASEIEEMVRFAAAEHCSHDERGAQAYISMLWDEEVMSVEEE